MVEGDHKELLERAKGGEIAAFGLLFERERALVEGKVRQIFHNKHDVDDVVQETFLKGHDAIRSFRGDSKLSSWLCKIAINLCMDRLRKEHAHPHDTLDGSFPEEQVRSPRENPQGGRTKRGGKIERHSAFRCEQNEEDREVQHEELIHIVQTVLGELNPQEASAIKLRFYKRARTPARETAAIVGFNKRSKIYDITRKFVSRCLKVREEMLRPRKVIQPVKKSP